MKGNFFFKNKHHIGVVHEPNFHLSARSTSFFRAFFVHFYGETFYGSPDITYGGGGNLGTDGRKDGRMDAWPFRFLQYSTGLRSLRVSPGLLPKK